MYESIRGRLLERSPASAVVDCAGLAYRVQIPLSTYERLPASGTDVTLLLHLVVREDEWRLFGFSRADERESFRVLVKVNGVGPVLALSVLSGFTPDDFTAAVTSGDVKALMRVKGVGRKTAERIIVELRGALPDRMSATSDAPAEDVGVAAEAIHALEALGQDADQARKKVTKAIAALGEDADVSALVRMALRS